MATVIIRPTSDNARGVWVNSSDGTTNLYSYVDEDTLSIVDYCKCTLADACSMLLFNLTDVAITGVVINKITIYVNTDFNSATAPDSTVYGIHVYTHAIRYDYAFTRNGSNYGIKELTLNPYTGVGWDIAEINALIAGVGGYFAKSTTAKLFQMYVEVDYTVPLLPYNFKDVKTALMSKAHIAVDPNTAVTGFNFTGLINLVDALCDEREAGGVTCNGHTNLRPTTTNQRNYKQFYDVYAALKSFVCDCNAFACSCNNKALATCTCNGVCTSRTLVCGCNTNAECGCDTDCTCDTQGGCGVNWGCTCEYENCSDESLCICQSESGGYCICNYDGGSCECEYNSWCSCNTDCECQSVCSSDSYICASYVAACTPHLFTCPCTQYYA